MSQVPSLCSVPSYEHLKKRRQCPHVIILCLRLIYENKLALMKSPQRKLQENFLKNVHSLFTEQKSVDVFPSYLNRVGHVVAQKQKLTALRSNLPAAIVFISKAPLTEKI